MVVRLIIVGARDHARLVHDAVLAVNEVRPTFEFEGFVNYGPSRPDVIAKRGAPILGDLDYFDRCDPDVTYIVGLGSPAERRRVDRILSQKDFRAATVIHPTAVLSPYVGTIDAGCYVGPLAVIQTEATLKRHVHVGTHADVGHDNVLGAFTTVSPGVMSLGHVRYGEGVMVGASATILPKVAVGDWCTVGAGAVVREDVDRGLTVIGVPAGPITGHVSDELEL